TPSRWGNTPRCCQLGCGQSPRGVLGGQNPPPSVTKLRLPLSQLRLQACDNAGVHLAHARLAQVEGRADLFHRHVLVIVEDDDEALVAIEATSHEPHEIAILQAMRGVLCLLIFQDVDLAYILVTVRFVPFLVEAYQTDGSGIAH